jgi:hypothetical protein
VSDREPKVGEKFTSVGTDEDGEDEELTIQEVVSNPDLTDGNFEVVAEEDGETYEVHDDGAGNWVSD